MKEEVLKLIKDAIPNGEHITHVAIKVQDRTASDKLKNYLEQFGFALGAELNNEYLAIDLSNGHINKASTSRSMLKSYKVFRSATQFIGFGAHCELADKILSKSKKLSKCTAQEKDFWNRLSALLPAADKEKDEVQRIAIRMQTNKLKDELRTLFKSLGLRTSKPNRKGTCYINVEKGLIYTTQSILSNYQIVREFINVREFKKFLKFHGLYSEEPVLELTVRSRSEGDKIQDILFENGYKWSGKLYATHYKVTSGMVYAHPNKTISTHKGNKQAVSINYPSELILYLGKQKTKTYHVEPATDSNGSCKIDFNHLRENLEDTQKPKNNNTDGERRKEGRVPNIQTASALVTRGTGREGRKVRCKAREAFPTRGHCSY